MHRALTLPELLSIIFANLTRNESAAVARICRTWSPIALDRTWESIPCIKFLINVYSPLSQNQDGLLEFRDTPDESRLTIFWDHARRVREAAYSGNLAPAVIVHISRQLADSGRGQRLLPNLKSINVQGAPTNVQLLPFVLILPPTVETFRLEGGNPSNSSTFLELSQALDGAQLHGFKVIEALCSITVSHEARIGWWNLLSKQGRLEILDLQSFAPIAEEDLQAIGELHCLRELLLDICSRSAVELSRIYTTLGKLFPNLRSIIITDDTECEIDIRVMEGLSPCRDLRVTELACKRPLPVTRNAVESLALCLPRLEELNFQAHTSSRDDYLGTSLTRLEDIALGWSKTMARVHLSFDSTEETPPASEIRGRFDRLEKIVVDNCDLSKDSVLRVAEFLATLCPGCVDITCETAWEDESYENWETVQECVDMIFNVIEARGQ